MKALSFEYFDVLHKKINEYRSMLWSLRIFYLLKSLKQKQTQTFSVLKQALSTCFIFRKIVSISNT